MRHVIRRKCSSPRLLNMPSTIQCRTCCLAFNTRVSGVGDYRQFAYCGDCGVLHIVRFQVDRGGLRFVDAEYDTEYDTAGPRQFQ